MGLQQWLFGTAQGGETRSEIGPTVSISDPALAAWLGLSVSPVGEVTDDRAMGVSAYWRCITLIAGTIAGLPLKTYKRDRTGTATRVTSFLDNPAGPYSRGGLSPFVWKELVVGHIATRGDAYLEHVYNGAGGIVGLLPVPPALVTPKWTDKADKTFQIQRQSGPRELDANDMTQVMGFSADGLHGYSPLTLFRKTFQTSLGGELAAAKSFSGAMISGLVSTEEEVDGDDAKEISDQLNAKVNGTDNVNKIAFVNRNLKFTPWTMSAADAQFIESRQFQVEEWARIYGVPTNLLSVAGAVSNWGTGVAEANLGLQRYTLMSYTSRIEEALTALLPANTYAEFDYKGLLQGTPAEEIALVISQVESGLLTMDEGRALLGRAPLPAPKALPAPKPKPQKEVA